MGENITEKIMTTVIAIIIIIAIALALPCIKEGFEDIHISIPEVETTETDEIFTELAVQMEVANLRGEKFTLDFN